MDTRRHLWARFPVTGDTVAAETLHNADPFDPTHAPGVPTPGGIPEPRLTPVERSHDAAKARKALRDTGELDELREQVDGAQARIEADNDAGPSPVQDREHSGRFDQRRVSPPANSVVRGKIPTDR